MARGLILLGVLLVIGGALWLYFPRAFSWFGSLPGDIRIDRDGFRVFAPLTSMLLLSLAISGIVWLVQLLRR